MNAWRALLLISLALLGGCLVTFKEPIAPQQAAPEHLLGSWTRIDEYGEEQVLEISRSAENRYRAVTYVGDRSNTDSLLDLPFTVARHGQRWYFSAELPRSQGGNFALAGFEITDKDELVVYSLDVEQILADIGKGRLQGQKVDSEQGAGALVSSPLSQVLAYLDDPSNADVFTEALRFQRVKPGERP
ncbi:MAG: hypothetical protein GAK43_00522 [Stenotrophomonas maltophilia]|nr:MAG: hypothetical protein GAK43_00522 [Stenotrophomonas maltophilia]